MGYMTKFDIYTFDTNTREPIPREQEYDMTYELEQIAFGKTDREDFEKYGPVSFDTWTGDEMKWYDHEDDMIALSKNHPNVIFIVEGVGEEFPDAWRMWVHNGIMEKSYAVIKYPEPENVAFKTWNIF